MAQTCKCNNGTTVTRGPKPPNDCSSSRTTGCEGCCDGGVLDSGGRIGGTNRGVRVQREYRPIIDAETMDFSRMPDSDQWSNHPGFIGGLLDKKDCWKCVGSSKLKRRVSKFLPCPPGFSKTEPNCVVRVVSNRPTVTVRPTGVTVRPNTGVVKPNLPVRPTVTVRPNRPVPVRPNIPVKNPTTNAPGWWGTISTPVPVQPPTPPQIDIPVTPPEPTIINNYYTSETETETAGMGDNKMLVWLGIGGVILWYLSKEGYLGKAKK